jgi:hypothetical protein
MGGYRNGHQTYILKRHRVKVFINQKASYHTGHEGDQVSPNPPAQEREERGLLGLESVVCALTSGDESPTTAVSAIDDDITSVEDLLAESAKRGLLSKKGY